MDIPSLLHRAEKALLPIFSEIDAQVKENLRQVLAAFRENRVGVHHFASVSGYGHDDLGRDTLDQVFAQALGAERRRCGYNLFQEPMRSPVPCMGFSDLGMRC